MLGTPKMVVVGLAAALALVGACGDGEDRPGQVTSESSGSATHSGSGSGTGSGTGSGAASAGAGGYTPVSDVDAHAAIGDDVAAIKQRLEAAKQGTPVDWAAVRTVWEGGGASKKSDGSNRTLKTLVGDAATVRMVDEAIAGAGGSAGAPDTVRAQRVDKGITVLLAAKVLEELDAAGEKVASKEVAPATGAPHNVDEAWAFFTAKGHGPAATAEKRAADFKREGKVLEPIVAGLAAAQAAAGEGDAAAIAEASRRVREGLHYVFYLATFKYLGAGDEVGRAEGAAFYRGIQDAVAAADREADQAIVAAFASGEAPAGRAALHREAVVKALGVDAGERVS